MKSQPNDLALLSCTGCDPIDRCGAIFRLGADNVYSIESKLRECLEDQHPMVRAESLNVLLGLWSRVDLISYAQETIDGTRRGMSGSADDIVDERMAAADALALYAGNEPELRQEVLGILRDGFTRGYHEDIRASCYRAFLRIIKRPAPRSPLKIPEDINWKIVNMVFGR